MEQAGKDTQDGPLAPDRVTHSASYEFSPADLAKRIGLEPPGGAGLAVTHVAARGRVSKIDPGAKIVFTVTWETGPDGPS